MFAWASFLLLSVRFCCATMMPSIHYPACRWLTAITLRLLRSDWLARRSMRRPGGSMGGFNSSIRRPPIRAESRNRINTVIGRGRGIQNQARLRVGGSTYYGPYLNRGSQFYLPGEAPPRKLPATAAGLDVQYAQALGMSMGNGSTFASTIVRCLLLPSIPATPNCGAC